MQVDLSYSGASRIELSSGVGYGKLGWFGSKTVPVLNWIIGNWTETGSERGWIWVSSGIDYVELNCY